MATDDQLDTLALAAVQNQLHDEYDRLDAVHRTDEIEDTEVEDYVLEAMDLLRASIERVEAYRDAGGTPDNAAR